MCLSCVGVHVTSLDQVYQKVAILWMMWQRGFIGHGYRWEDCACQRLPCCSTVSIYSPHFLPGCHVLAILHQQSKIRLERAAVLHSKYSVVGMRQGSKSMAESQAFWIQQRLQKRNAWGLDFLKHLDSPNAENSPSFSWPFFLWNKMKPGA